MRRFEVRLNQRKALYLSAMVVGGGYYVRAYNTNAERAALFPDWLHLYNHHQSHTALGGRSPVDSVNNLPENYS
jgi:transposase InsO family protein